MFIVFIFNDAFKHSDLMALPTKYSVAGILHFSTHLITGYISLTLQTKIKRAGLQKQSDPFSF